MNPSLMFMRGRLLGQLMTGTQHLNEGIAQGSGQGWMVQADHGNVRGFKPFASIYVLYSQSSCGCCFFLLPCSALCRIWFVRAVNVPHSCVTCMQANIQEPGRFTTQEVGSLFRQLLETRVGIIEFVAEWSMALHSCTQGHRGLVGMCLEQVVLIRASTNAPLLLYGLNSLTALPGMASSKVCCLSWVAPQRCGFPLLR